jgi:hypothetical protein
MAGLTELVPLVGGRAAKLRDVRRCEPPGLCEWHMTGGACGIGDVEMRCVEAMTGDAVVGDV